MSMRLFYSLLFVFLLPIIFIRLWLRGASAPSYRQRWAERLGYSRGRNNDNIVYWFHTVSVGEFIAAKPLIEQFIDKQNCEVLVTTMTPTGSDRVMASFGERVMHCYLPYDVPSFIHRFLRRYKPRVFICLETELWPNLIHCCSEHNIPVIIANARLSEKSARGYRKLSWLARPMLERISIAAIQNHDDAERFIQLGLKQRSKRITGNIKFDLELSDALKTQASQLKQQLSDYGNYPIWITASTHQGEDEIILEAYHQLQQIHPTLRLLLVPRHPERFDRVFALCQQYSEKCIRRSTTINADHNTALASFDIMLGDTMGELLLLLGASDLCFIGGSLVENGGHNYIEAAAWQLPIVTGPSTFNFREIARELIEHKALTLCKDTAALVDTIDHLLQSPEQSKAMGQRGFDVAERNRGALQRLTDIINQSVN